MLQLVIGYLLLPERNIGHVIEQVSSKGMQKPGRNAWSSGSTLEPLVKIKRIRDAAVKRIYKEFDRRKLAMCAVKQDYKITHNNHKKYDQAEQRKSDTRVLG